MDHNARRAGLQAEAARLRESAAHIRQAAHRADSRKAYDADMKEASRLEALATRYDTDAAAVGGGA